MSAPNTVTAPHHREPALDGLRGLAVTLVFVFHYGGGLTSHNPLIRFFGHLTAAGWTGVQIFFVLSGFLITGILWRDLQSTQPHLLRNFYIRRILRIVPLAWAAITLSCLLCLAMGFNPPALHGYIFEYLFLQDIPSLVRTTEHVQKLALFHFWTIAVELQFYLLWPLLLLLCRRSLRAAQALCFAVFALSLTANAAFVLHPGLIPPELQQRSPLTYSGALSLGGFLALSLRQSTSPEAKLLQRLALPALLLGSAAYIAASLQRGSFLLLGKQYITGLPSVWIASAGLLLLLLRPGVPHTLFSNAILRFIGRYSYGIYVLHVLLEPLFSYIGVAVSHRSSGYFFLATRLITGFPITLAFAWVSYQLLEFPFLKLKRYFPSAPALLASETPNIGHL